MHSYEDRIRAVELYYRYGKKASVVVMELGYPATKQLGRWVRIYEEKGDLPRELKPRERYSCLLYTSSYLAGFGVLRDDDPTLRRRCAGGR